MYETDELATEAETWGEEEYGETDLGEEMEAELVDELLEITTEAELEQFLGKLARGVISGASKFLTSPVGAAVKGVLRKVAKTALPMVGGAIGSFIAPGVGTALGSKLGSMAGGLLEAEEAESMGEAEAEYEAARRYIRFARSTIRNGYYAPRGIPSRSVARAAAVTAARRHAPSLLHDRRRRRGRRPARRRPYRPVRFEPVPWLDDDEPTGDRSGDNGDADDWSDAGDAGDADTDEAEDERRYGGWSRRRSSGTWIRNGDRIVVLGV